ncbi:MAG: DUF3604 domain-containing protein [Myxococcota bacterium]
MYATRSRSTRRRWSTPAVLALAALVGCERIDDPSLQPAYDPATAEPPPAKASIEFDADRHLLWGDLHVHTAQSYDAYTMGTRALADDAYLYMKGGTIEHALGYAVRATRPLDFGAVTDHAEYLGVARAIDPDPDSSRTRLREIVATGNPLRITLHSLRVMLGQMGSRETRDESFGQAGLDAVSRAAWQENVAAALRHDDPGRFTAFIGYEWSSMPNEENLHRNVIYAGARVPERPFSSLDSEDPEDLWTELERQRKAGMDAIAIPHNGNVSNGRMYVAKTFDGEPLSAAYARLRTANEPVSEIFQVKGASETHPTLSPDDGFAGFELYDQVMAREPRPSAPKGSYYRDALRTGLELAHREGFNPFVLGAIGSSDSHNATSETDEKNYHGKLPMMDGSAGLRLGVSTLSFMPKLPSIWSAAGLAGVWAEENSRASIFAAMNRRETYATSGPRISVRFFAGRAYPDDLPEAPGWVSRAYATGVPMGGELAPARDGTSPVFVVSAAKDPLGANLDRIQIIKAWVDAAGASREAIHDVAASGDRLARAVDGAIEPVGSSVDVAAARYANSIGASELAAVWRDPDFDPGEEALYYARVIEIPTPRHTTYAARTLGRPAPEPTAIQERAVTSAIWIRTTRRPADD